MISIHLVNMYFLICSHFATKEGPIYIFHRTKLILSQFLNDGFPPLSLIHCRSLHLFITSLFFLAASQSHRSSQSSECHSDRCHVWHNVSKQATLSYFSQWHFLSLFHPPPPLSCVVSGWFRGAKFLHECPEAFSSYEWQMQTALVRGVAHLSTDFPVVSSFEP